MYFFINKIRPSVIHINNGGYPGATSCNVFVLAARIAGINNIVYQVNNIAYPHKSRLSRWVDKNIINAFVKCFITASQKARESLSEKRGFSLDKIAVIPNTILNKEVGRSRKDVFEELFWPIDSFFVCQTAFLSQRKGQLFLLEAINKIRLLNKKIFEKIKVTIIGDGEDEKRLKQFVKDNDLGDKIVFTGYRSDSLDFINACDVFVLPSIANEDMPLVVLEAMSLKKIIIASRFGGIEEELENNISGILIEPNLDTLSIDMAEAMIRIFTDKNYEQYGLRAKERYDKYFSPEIRQLNLLNVYSLESDNNI
jgi:glycosyltransferase involved in cell wall biosynthesis